MKNAFRCHLAPHVAGLYASAFELKLDATTGLFHVRARLQLLDAGVYSIGLSTSPIYATKILFWADADKPMLLCGECDDGVFRIASASRIDTARSKKGTLLIDTLDTIYLRHHKENIVIGQDPVAFYQALFSSFERLNDRQADPLLFQSSSKIVDGSATGFADMDAFARLCEDIVCAHASPDGHRSVTIVLGRSPDHRAEILAADLDSDGLALLERILERARPIGYRLYPKDDFATRRSHAREDDYDLVVLARDRHPTALENAALRVSIAERLARLEAGETLDIS